MARSQGRIIFHTWNQAKGISSVASTVCHYFLAIEESGFDLDAALTCFGARASNLTSEKEFGFAAVASTANGLCRCPAAALRFSNRKDSALSQSRAVRLHS